jgi:class 3 adenylate cyclase/pimeloyl-ACP methyl ester carboxylesterase
VDRPETRFAWNGEISLAYQIVGEGPIDLVYLQSPSQVDLSWDGPHLSRFLRGLGRHARLIIMDRRGWGCSERFSPNDVSDIDELTDDLIAVMDAAGSERAAVFANLECGLVSMLFTAAYPERVAALVLVDAYATYSWTEETPWAPTVGYWEQAVSDLKEQWGTAAYTDGAMSDPREAGWFERYARASVTPGGLAAEIRRYAQTDVRAVLPTIQVPTLIFADLDGSGESTPEAGRFLADRIPESQLVEQSSGQINQGWHWYTRGDEIVEEVGRFLEGVQQEDASFDRVLATVLFTDIVDSTATAAQMGDRAWSDLLQRHHTIVRSLLARYRGKEVDTAGDGFLATFDGPARGIRCAQAIVEAVRPLGIEIRAGVHTGEVETIDGKVGGITVHIGARVGALAGPSEVLVSRTVKDLVVGSGLVFEDRGEHELKGVPDPWLLYQVVK